MQALEVGHLGVIAGVDERLEAGLHELGGAAAEDGLLAEQIGLGLVLEARLDHAAARAADALGVGERERAALPVASCSTAISPGTPLPSVNWRRTRWPGPLGATIPTSTPGGRLDLPVVDREAVAEQDHVALGDPVADLLLPDVVVELVGQQDHHEVAAAGGLDDGQHLEALLARLGDRGGVLAQADHDVDAGVLQVEGVGVALGAVADDRDGLAVEEREVCVVVVDHWTAQAIRLTPVADATSVRPGERAQRIPSDPSAAVYGAKRARRPAWISAISSCGRASTASWKTRERSSVVSQNSSKLVAARQVERLHAHLGEAGLLEQLTHALGAAERERTRRAGDRRRALRPRSRSSAPAAAPTGCARSRPTRPARRARRGAARGASRAAPRRVGHQHVAPAAQHRVDARHRQVDPFGVQHLELDVAQAELGRPLARAGEHRLGLVGDDRAADRRDQLGGEHARLAEARRQLEHALAGLRGDRVDQPVRHRRAELAQHLLAAHPAGGGLFPACEARVAVGVRRRSSSQLPAQQLARARARQRLAAQQHALGHLVRGERPRRSGRAAPRRRARGRAGRRRSP